MLWSLTPETKEIWDTGLTLHLKTYDFSSVVGEVVCIRFIYLNIKVSSLTGNRTRAAAVRAPNPNH